MMHLGTSPYGIDVWYPVLRGGPAPTASFVAGDPRAEIDLHERWAKLEAGERVVLLASPARAGERAALDALESALDSPGTVERYVVFPGTGESFTLLPTNDGASLRGGMPLLPRDRARGRALWTVLKSLSPLGVTRRLGRPEVAIWTKGAARPEETDLAIVPLGGSLAVTAGEPDRNQKIIVRALDRRGTARTILKLGASERTDDAVGREAAALEEVAELLPDRAPKLLAQGERAGRTWLAQEVLDGRYAGEILSPAHAEFLVELGTRTAGRTRLEHVDMFADARRHLAALQPDFDPDWHIEYERLRDALLAAYTDDESVPTTAAHGDFTPWNVVLQKGRLRAFDWEYFHAEAPALYDLIHFHVQACVLVRQFPGERIFDSLDAYFRGPAAEAVKALELSPADVLRALGLYVFHEGTAAEIQERLRPAPFVQATWLRRARLELCHRVAGLLLERRLPRWATDVTSDGRAAA